MDNGSSDASPEMLETTLGADRVIRLGQNRGFGGAAAEALRSAAAERADYLLLLHDDTVLAADAVERLVDTAERVDGAGVVGAKIRDADHPDVLLDVGQTIDRFGYPYSPLEAGEIDQGQYDRLREVMAVSSSAMLVRGDLAGAIGLPDDRFPTRFADVDFCWRARVAGYRVLMAPRAVALHRSAGGRGQRSTTTGRFRGARYERERAGLAGVLKNYRLLTLLWMLPLWAAQSVARTVYLLLSRRFEDAFQMTSAVWWNVRHLPGTLRVRRRAQRARRTRDHEVRRFMAPGRRAGAALGDLGRGVGPSPGDGRGGRRRDPRVRLAPDGTVRGRPPPAGGLGGCRPARRSRLSPPGGRPPASWVARSPRSPPPPRGSSASSSRACARRASGGRRRRAPHSGLLGLGSVAALGSTELLQKAMLFVLPAAAAVGAARATRRVTGLRVPSVVAGAVYALSPVVLWAFSEGLIPVLVFLAGLPWLASRLQVGFSVPPGRARVRWAIGVGAGLAVLVSFFPGTLLAAAIVLLLGCLRPERERGAEDSLSRPRAPAGRAACLPVRLGALSTRRAGHSPSRSACERSPRWPGSPRVRPRAAGFLLSTCRSWRPSGSRSSLARSCARPSGRGDGGPVPVPGVGLGHGVAAGRAGERARLPGAGGVLLFADGRPRPLVVGRRRAGHLRSPAGRRRRPVPDRGRGHPPAGEPGSARRVGRGRPQPRPGRVRAGAGLSRAARTRGLDRPPDGRAADRPGWPSAGDRGSRRGVRPIRRGGIGWDDCARHGTPARGARIRRARADARRSPLGRHAARGRAAGAVRGALSRRRTGRSRRSPFAG